MEPPPTNDDPELPIAVAAAYLALVLRYVRCWFIATKKGLFGEFSLNWSCNLGLPAAIDDDEVLRNAFNKAGKAAWIISRAPGRVTIDAARKAVDDFNHSDFDADDMPWEFELFPEVIAEVTGYVRSSSGNRDIHLFLDIGASTLDVCSFILHERDGGSHIPILTADVAKFGAKGLHLQRINGAKAAVANHAAKCVADESDPVSPIPDDFAVYVPTDQEVCSEVAKAEDEFKLNCKKRIYCTLHSLLNERNPGSTRWGTFRVFACGGATAMKAYQEVVSGIDKWFHDGRHKQNIKHMRLSKPESLNARIDDDSYHRLAVAWGLSHLNFNISTYSRPGGIEDVKPPPIRDVGKTFIGQEQV